MDYVYMCVTFYFIFLSYLEINDCLLVTMVKLTSIKNYKGKMTSHVYATVILKFN